MSGGSNLLRDLVKQVQSGVTPVIETPITTVSSEEDTASNDPTSHEEVSPSEDVVKEKRVNKNIDKQNNDSKKGKEVKKSKGILKSGTIVEKINSLEKLERSAQMIHIRITPETHKKLLLYQMGEDKLSIQSIVNYAIVSMLDDKEMKDLLTNIKNGMV